MYVKPTLVVLAAHSTELFDEVGDRIRDNMSMGQQLGRPRRVGWFDSVVMRHSRRVSELPTLGLNRSTLCPLGYSEICSLRLDKSIDHYPAA